MNIFLCIKILSLVCSLSFAQENEVLPVLDETSPVPEYQEATPGPIEANFGSSEYEGGVEAPNFGEDWICGYANKFNVIHLGYTEEINDQVKIHHVYYLNETAEQLAAKGFYIKVNKVGYGDVLCSFTFFNGIFENTLSYTTIGSILGSEQNPSEIMRSYYMALIGEIRGDNLRWLCDGVLINHRWILSAANCFTKAGGTPNVVRLGDFDLNSQADQHQSASNKFIRDYHIERVVFHPNFKDTEEHHNLVLIQIPRAIPLRGHNFFPICLPWGTETNRNLVGETVTLSGWGRTEKDNMKNTQMLDINVTVFNNSVCYKDVRVHEENIRDNKLFQVPEDSFMCAGSTSIQRAVSCFGDSGSPIVYLKTELDKSKIKPINIHFGKTCETGEEGKTVVLEAQTEKFILAGIVSRKYECGVERPGIYTPINKPMYLQWIKNIAFSDYV